MSNEARDIAYVRASNFMEDTIMFNGKFIGKLYDAFKSYHRKASELNEKNEKILQALQKYADSIFIYNSLRFGMAQVTMCLYTLTALSNFRTKDIHDGVLVELKKFDKICNNGKKDAKHTRHAVQNQTSSRRELEKIIHDSPRNSYRIRRAENRYTKDTENVACLMSQLEEQVIHFQMDKTSSLKKSLLLFVKAEIFYHSKALELFQHTYTRLTQVDEEHDMQEFIKKLKIPKTTPVHAKANTSSKIVEANTSTKMFKVNTSSQSTPERMKDIHRTPERKKATQSTPERKKESLFTAPLRNIRNFVTNQKNISPGNSTDSVSEQPKPQKKQHYYTVEIEY